MNDVKDQLETLWTENLERFPFSGYIAPARKSAYFALVEMMAEKVSRNARILDFGCGPMDKTVMFRAVTDDLHAFDTFQDTWHLINENKSKIVNFGENNDITVYETFDQAMSTTYDVIMLHDVIEHFHESPRHLLNSLIKVLNKDGLLIITVPNAGNIRKRLALLSGGTNYQRYEYFYWYPEKWDGHVREYVQSDLVKMARYLRMQIVSLQTFHIHLDVLPPFVRPIWETVSKFIPNCRDSFYIIMRKPDSWAPYLLPDQVDFSAAFYRQYFSKLVDREKLYK